MPTGVAVSSTGQVYVSDGYGNFKVQRFSADEKHLGNWGSQGKGAGQFALVHNVEIDGRDLVYVCDRENGRIQVFDGDGKYVREWGGMQLPENIDIDGEVGYICEEEAGDDPAVVSVFSLDGKLLSRWTNKEPEGKGTMNTAHGIAVDSHGDLYLADNPGAYENQGKGPAARVVKFILQ
jgi:streptogramin lyase